MLHGALIDTIDPSASPPNNTNNHRIYSPAHSRSRPHIPPGSCKAAHARSHARTHALSAHEQPCISRLALSLNQALPASAVARAALVARPSILGSHQTRAQPLPAPQRSHARAHAAAAHAAAAHAKGRAFVRLPAERGMGMGSEELWWGWLPAGLREASAARASESATYSTTRGGLL